MWTCMVEQMRDSQGGHSCYSQDPATFSVQPLQAAHALAWCHGFEPRLSVYCSICVPLPAIPTVYAAPA